MSLANILRQIRTEVGFTQRALANEVGVDQSRISAYERGEEIPADVAVNISRVLKSPRLKQAISIEKKSQVVCIPMLNNVNEDPVVIIDSLIEEAEELIESAIKLKKIIRNKKGPDDIEEFELEKIMNFEEQIADILPCTQLHFIRMAEIFKLDIGRLESKMLMKLKRKKHLI